MIVFGIRQSRTIEADEIAGGHLVALSNPAGLTQLLHTYAAEV